ncbi:mannose-1-phosphate guanylyltransferase/mannose-6-phosphate isomerase [Vibrio splendidus]|uniref:mannose-1-phosphate guanylyltransferase/mannose-6-phosphate isomerase n=1 Tax=Vibrio splendidus TaxID=29497 RepID=UPI000C840DDC|nr:mannose-1-phosphate guanylyltransferase/mannose-6-phosphate isomerase [Vibrio splendidus]PMI70693.1 mannose-1-phosphate guanylyltransferase/mannose-6-phosphate isomerase [Vibrio splendidus]PMK14033.1 mannose-1-phosphate guanylyltransferase/mannose-6-phosphate isomerase [Vibrio splendidus]PMK60449.1 mannose-1-phosphate guanylyltransferase/mannose-6-phosphate isomerase [Vibrio splendidus]
MIFPVIMAGGSGSRLWPLSRTSYPKQFLPLTSDETMLQQTILRTSDLDTEDPFIICNEDHRFLVAEQLRQLDHASQGILLEPVGRNTAPAVALAAMYIANKNPEALMLILAADHDIRNNEAFQSSVKTAIPYASSGKMVTFGIEATTPETGYGYIRKGLEVNDCNFQGGYLVDRFVEKPDLEAAELYLKSKEYLWNSGMFLFKASTYLSELKKYRLDIFDACQNAYNTMFVDLDFIRMSSDTFNDIPDESIDFAVMEKTDKAVVIPMNAHWSDVGSWSALWDVSLKDQYGNSKKGDVVTEQTCNSFIYAQNKLVTTVGVNNLVVVETKDAVLVADKDRVQDVKSIVNHLKSADRLEHIQHREVYRPWGVHETIAEGERFKCKQVLIKPRQKTALQMHHHRAEHWVVVSGTAKVTKGDEVFLLTENQSTYIPVGVLHSIENPGQLPLEIIEVCSGSYFKEDDIIRFNVKDSESHADY